MLVANSEFLPTSVEVCTVRAVSISVNVVLKCSFFHVGTSDRSVIMITAVNVVTNTQGIWLNLPKCIPLQSKLRASCSDRYR